MKIQKLLKENSDEKYKEFHSKLMPTVPKEKILGVRTPILRKIAKNLYGTKEAEEFIHSLPHEYYEENNLHAFIIENIKDFDGCLCEVNKFLPYIDNWATCDSMSPAVFKKHPEAVKPEADKWLTSNHIYTVRYGIAVYMKYFLEDKFESEHLEKIAEIKSNEYYINMMRAWYFATALAKQYEKTIPYIEKHILDEWTHKKTIQKAVESFRISHEQKEYLRKLK